MSADPDGSNHELLVTELPKASDFALDPVGGKVNESTTGTKTH